MCLDDLKTWAPVLSALAACAAAVIAARNVVLTNRNTLRTRALDLLHKAEQQWDSDRMWKFRVKASKALLDGDHGSHAIDAVLDFIDGVGRMVKENDMSNEHVWESFYYWFSCYLDTTVEARAEARKEDRTIWENAVALRPILTEQQRVHLGKEKPSTQADLTEFLTIESKLND